MSLVIEDMTLDRYLREREEADRLLMDMVQEWVEEGGNPGVMAHAILSYGVSCAEGESAAQVH